MPSLEKQKHGSFFLKPSSSFARQTVHITCLLMWLPSMSFAQETKGTTFCFDTREGHRLNATVHKKLHAWHDVDCVVRCLDDTCCRSVNYLKTLDFDKEEDDNKDNCELLHDAAVSAKNSSLPRNGDYDYFILRNPERSFHCSCVSCENNKTCNASSEKCECPAGFKGLKCEVDIDECIISKPCDTNATCENFVGSYNCTCKKGFTGNGTTCTDIDECISKPCDTNATCENFVGSYNCTCNKGFTGNGTTCTDIDECISKPCDTNATCQNFVGSYNCTCKKGFTGNGTTCADIDECISKPCDTNATCENFVGSYNCTCKKGFTGNGTTCTAKNCPVFYNMNFTQNGVYSIDPDGLGSFNVSCDMTTDGGGWTVFQRRQDGSVDFYRNWIDYKNGFGNMSCEFWLGLDKINRLTRNQEMKLRIDLEDFEGGKRYAKYSKFVVEDENESNKLTFGGYEGDAGESLEQHNGMKFSTKDRDNDLKTGRSCAQDFNGAWWYNSCHDSNLNGRYLAGRHTSRADGVNWYHWRGDYYSLKKAEMKIRP